MCGKKACEGSEWTADEPAGCTDADRRDKRGCLYDEIEKALQPPALDWDKIYETKQRQGERASEFMDRLMQTLLQYGGFQVEGGRWIARWRRHVVERTSLGGLWRFVDPQWGQVRSE